MRSCAGAAGAAFLTGTQLCLVTWRARSVSAPIFPALEEEEQLFVFRRRLESCI